jgi:membrane protein implicated in regulation of membrane protease activity
MAERGTATRVVAHAALAVPVVAILWVPLYARTEPRLAGLPFFYWYQFAWIVLTLALMAISYRLLRSADRREQ